MRGQSSFIAKLSTAMALGSLACTTGAQSVLDETVTARPRQQYEAIGWPAGGFRLFPSIEAGARYDSNIFALDVGTVDDFIFDVRPGARLASDWNNHALNLFGNADVGRYADSSAEDFVDLRFGGDGRLDVTRDTNLTAAVNYSALHEDRGSPDDTRGAEPTEYELFAPRVGAFHRFGRFNVTLDGALQAFDFQAPRIGPNQDDRDRDQWSGSARLGYEIQPGYEAFVRGGLNQRDYDSAVDDNGFNRDSDGFETVVGVAFELTGTAAGSAFVGYREQDYDDPALRTVDGVQLGGDVTWNVTRLTTIKAGVERQVRETTIAGAAGSFDTRVSGSVDHELLRNLIIGASLSYSNADYEGIARKDDIIGAGVYGKYLINRNFSVTANYRFTDRDSNQAGADYAKSVAGVTLRAQY